MTTTPSLNRRKLLRQMGLALGAAYARSSTDQHRRRGRHARQGVEGLARFEGI